MNQAYAPPAREDAGCPLPGAEGIGYHGFTRRELTMRPALSVTTSSSWPAAVAHRAHRLAGRVDRLRHRGQAGGGEVEQLAVAERGSGNAADRADRIVGDSADRVDRIVDGREQLGDELRIVVERLQGPLDDRPDIVEPDDQRRRRLDALDVDLDLVDAGVGPRGQLEQIGEPRVERDMDLEVVHLEVICSTDRLGMSSRTSGWSCPATPLARAPSTGRALRRPRFRRSWAAAGEAESGERGGGREQRIKDA